MTEEQLEALEPALAGYLDHFLFCCGYTQTFAHLGTYVRGLMSDLPRKTVEPIAVRAGKPVRTLQEFLRDHVWSFGQVRDHLQGHVADLLPALPKADDLGTVGLLDETSSAKKGDKTPATARQYLGCLGKVDNGIVVVHRGLCRGLFKTLVDADLYLPKEWDADRDRCRAAGIPDTVVYRPKWQIALDQFDRAKNHGIVLDWLTFDEAYGKCPGFLRGLDERQQGFVGEVPRSFSCLAANRTGRRPDAAVKGRAAGDVLRSGTAFRSQPWQVLHLSRETLPDQVWRVKAAPVWLHSQEGWSSRTYWLIWASNDETGEEKFFLSNAPVEVSVAVLVRVAFRRWNVEHCFRVAKSELGYTHFEGRRYVALLRHLSLGLVALTFVAEQTDRLRGEKSRADDGARVRGPGRGVPGLAPPAARDDGQGMQADHHWLPPSTQPRRSRLEEEEGTCGQEPQEAPAAA